MSTANCDGKSRDWLKMSNERGLERFLFSFLIREMFRESQTSSRLGNESDHDDRLLN